VSSDSKRGLLLHNAPSLTIEARWNTPVRVKWSNDLKDAAGNFLPHLLPVEPTLHWANPPGGTEGRDMRPPSPARPVRIPVRCPSSPTCTALSAWAMRATATPRPGSYPRRTTSLRATRPRAPGTISSPVRRRIVSAQYGVQDSLSSNTRISTVPRPSGTTTTPWA
jgi:hypothetical protein